MSTTHATGVILLYNEETDEELDYQKAEIIIARVEGRNSREKYGALIQLRDKLKEERGYDVGSIESWLDGNIPVKRYPETP